MLQLQRASAGSGKTYTLAKQYIWYLIAVRESDGGWRLRKGHEIADGLRRILAITFTNKATNEMKERIVVRLRDLASTTGKAKMTEEEIKEVAYLEDYMTALGLSDHKPVAQAAVRALSAILNDFSNFKVSTIDSFFQSILRTFAYEVNLADSFQIEMDTDFLSAYAVDATLDKINTSAKGSNASFWMQILVDRAVAEGKGDWNVFMRSQKKASLIQRILKSVKELDKEDFRRAREVLDDYFLDSGPGDPLREAYTTLEAEMTRETTRLLRSAQDSAKALVAGFAQAGLDIASNGRQHLNSKIQKILTATTNGDELESFSKPDLSKTALSAKTKSAAGPHLLDLARDTFAKWYLFEECWNSPKWTHWRVYRQLIPFLGLIGEARKEIADYLAGVNSIHLGETSSILHRIVRDSDTPFVYERLGTTLDHYLIDEFQDTSRLQWDVLRPLVGESLSRGEDNLIIGDAKQSIYRFRSADPSLISTVVPTAFPHDVKIGGTSVKENTNHRSTRTVVEFNNMFFSLLSTKAEELCEGRIPLTEVYGNVSQYARHREREGYVEINFLERTTKKGKVRTPDDEEEDTTYDAQVFPRLGGLVDSLLERGYSQRDIAVLVRTNLQGKAVIEALREHNNRKSPGERQIEFLSEESLLIGSSEAVGIIITVLEKLVAGVFLTEDEGNKHKRPNWAEIKCNFNFYALRHTGESLTEQVTGFLIGREEGDPVGDMLAGMQTTALPALVEAIAESFIPRDLRRDQAVFIASFQDLVLSYCSGKVADTASFLAWWEEKGKKASIQSPSGIDAVQIMTIHKSKGLEFPCVILPYCNGSLPPGPSKTEWRWVEPVAELAGSGLPGVLPVLTSTKLRDTAHERELDSFVDMVVTDNINLAYVAFTRAVDELYVFTLQPSKKRTGSGSLGNCLAAFCHPEDGTLPAMEGRLDENCLDPSQGEWDEEAAKVSFGKKKDVVVEPEEGEAGAELIGEYGVNSSQTVLKFQEGDDGGTDSVRPEAADTDPRSEGNLIHAILEGVRSGADIERNARALCMRGLLKRRQAAEWVPWLCESIADPRVKDWFEGDWKVLSERSLLMGNATQIPDRVLISPDRRRVVVIDYKTGEIPKDDRHKDQVCKYMVSLREATGISDVTGWVWYLRKNRVVEV